ncbi:MAG TPA: MotA/TolQ/ExbB proton channel family protein [Longimicrobiales bacterium]|nr:MotA/TolQ/ExbB proton channel family protein [Longimicrobiales bacterium]
MLDSIWRDMGFIRWPLFLSVLVVVALSVWSTLRLFRPGAAAEPRTKAWVDAILFWGGFALISGVLGTLVGIIIAAQSIEAAGQISTTLVWGGIKVAMLSSVFGILILAGASLVWFVLQLRWRLLRAAAAPGGWPGQPAGP